MPTDPRAPAPEAVGEPEPRTISELIGHLQRRRAYEEQPGIRGELSAVGAFSECITKLRALDAPEAVALPELPTDVPIVLDEGQEHRAYNGEWFAPTMPDGYVWQICCDCGMAHRVYVRVKDGAMQFRFDVDEDATKAWRRREDMNFPLERKARTAQRSRINDLCQSEGPHGATICTLPLGHAGQCGWEAAEAERDALREEKQNRDDALRIALDQLAAVEREVTAWKGRVRDVIGEVSAAEAERDAWRDALDELHVDNWVGVIDGLSPREAVRVLLDRALDQERDALRGRLVGAEKLLDVVDTDDYGPQGGRVVKGNDKLPGCEDFYRGYNAGIDSQFEKTCKLVKQLRALLTDGAQGGAA